MKTLTFIFITLLLSGCVNKHGVSLKYYSECKEYYDMQGYYHKECGEDDIVTYKGVKDSVEKGVDYLLEDNQRPKRNVY